MAVAHMSRTVRVAISLILALLVALNVRILLNGTTAAEESHSGEVLA